VKLLVQPDDGVAPLVKGIDGARKTVEITIFRFDHRDIQNALINAVRRGVYVHALIACTNSGGEKNLRNLEMRLLGHGITVVRTASDLARYHDKLMIVDRQALFLTAFNFTYLDTSRSRSFGIVTKHRKAVLEAVKLFEADAKRQPYTPGLKTFVVSPENARKQIAAFLLGARKQLLIYDPKISDIPMIRLLQQLTGTGVKIKIIGKVTHKCADLEIRKLKRQRLHTRTIIRDRQQAFIGSQSLRGIELDGRREVGLIFRDSKAVGTLIKIFEKDWETATSDALSEDRPSVPAGKVAKRVAEAISKELPSLVPVMENTLKEVMGAKAEVKVNHKEVEGKIQEALKDVVANTVQSAMEGEKERK
jgi:phosphatidylserine/phosphatidylglycerophosphate/cardiolipin synthase-like enzyme